MPDASLTLVVAVLSFVLSAGLTINEVSRRLSSGRKADPVAWRESHGNAHYCVLVNRGPADARNVAVEFRDQDGVLAELDAQPSWPLPLKSLVAGDAVYLSYTHVPGQHPWVLWAHLSWEDGRRGRQSVARCNTLRPVAPRPALNVADELRRTMLRGS